MITDVFLDQKRVNVGEHTVKTASRIVTESAIRVGVRQEGGRNGGKIEWKSSEVNTRALCRGLNKMIGEFKMAVGDVVSIRVYIPTGST